jgi:hypothetical protein
MITSEQEGRKQTNKQTEKQRNKQRNRQTDKQQTALRLMSVLFLGRFCLFVWGSGGKSLTSAFAICLRSARDLQDAEPVDRDPCIQ